MAGPLTWPRYLNHRYVLTLVTGFIQVKQCRYILLILKAHLELADSLILVVDSEDKVLDPVLERLVLVFQLYYPVFHLHA